MGVKRLFKPEFVMFYLFIGATEPYFRLKKKDTKTEKY